MAPFRFVLAFSPHPHTKTHELVAIKQIALKSVPGKLSNIRQKEITILKVFQTFCKAGNKELTSGHTHNTRPSNRSSWFA